MAKWEGIFTILMTALTKRSEIDENAIRYTVDSLVEGGVHGLVPLGSAGEFPYLSNEEKKKVIDIVIDQANGRVPVLVGTSCMGTDETIRLSKYARDVGADGFMINLPIYLPLRDEDIYKHYEDVASEVEMPIMLYNIPSATHLNLTPEKVARLAEIDEVVGIKESIEDIAPIKTVIDQVMKKPFSVFTGFSNHLLEVLKIGGDGVIDQMSNIDPKTFVALFNAVKEGDMEKATKMQRKILDYWSLSKPAGIAWIAATKEIMQAMGQPIQSIVKRPLPQLTEEQKKLIREQLRAKGLIKEPYI